MYGIRDKRKVEFESFFIDWSCHIGPSRTSNWFDLNYPKDRDIIYLYYYIIFDSIKNGQSNLFLASIERSKKR